MGTGSNLYKNPSFTYNKDFNLNSVLQNLKAYNDATGNPVWRRQKQSPAKKKSSYNLTTNALRDQRFSLYRIQDMMMNPPSCLTMIIFTNLGRKPTQLQHMRN